MLETNEILKNNDFMLYYALAVKLESCCLPKKASQNKF